MDPIPTLAALVDAARRPQPLRIAIAAAESDTALEAAAEATRWGIARAVLVGDPGRITARLRALGEDPSGFDLVGAVDDLDAARRAVAIVRGGEAAVLMKGRLATGELLRAALDRDAGLRTGRLLSDVAIVDHPLSERPRLLGITDGGVNVAPTLAQKKEILLNAVAVFQALGYAVPKIAPLCAAETPSDAMPATRDAEALAAMAAAGELPGCLVSGPLALDGAVSVEAARAKGIDHPVAGRADVLLVSAIEVGNALAKGLNWFLGRPIAHVIAGARAPILIPSRVERPEDKLLSIALGIVVASLDSGALRAPTLGMNGNG
jgi:phosphate butyryltransferase